MISMEDKLTVLKNSVYNINCDLSAIDCDNCIEVLEQNLSRIFILGSDNQMHHLRQRVLKDVDIKTKQIKDFECMQTYDFSAYGEDYWVHENWEVCALDKGMITIDQFLILGEYQNYKLFRPIEYNMLSW